MSNESIDPELMRSILEHAKHAYGDLSEPSYEFYAAAFYQDWYKPLLNDLDPWFKIEKWSGPDDVSLSYVIFNRAKPEKTAEVWSLWLSAVGPFAFLCLSDPGQDQLCRTDVVTSISGVVPALHHEAQLILGTVQKYGFRLLEPAEVEATFDGFTHPDGIFPVTLFVLLFGDDGVPWQRES